MPVFTGSPSFTPFLRRRIVTAKTDRREKIRSRNRCVKPHRLPLLVGISPFANKTARRFIRHLTKILVRFAQWDQSGGEWLGIGRFNAGENNEPLAMADASFAYRVSYLRGRLRSVAPEQQNSAREMTADLCRVSG